MSNDWRRESRGRNRDRDAEVDHDGPWPGKRSLVGPRAPATPVDPGKRTPAQSLRPIRDGGGLQRETAKAREKIGELIVALHFEDFERVFVAATLLRNALKAARDEISAGKFGPGQRDRARRYRAMLGRPTTTDERS
jgi:hypothetical protein